MNHPQYLLRFDDLCPTMNWRVWSEIETILVQRDLKPLLAVVPDNHDPCLQVDAPVKDFWDRVRAWRDRGWTIALHGYQHRYVSRNAGLCATRKKSEFAGLPAEEQREKLRRGEEILNREGLTPRVWIAPGNTFDATTVALLPEFGIDVICDGSFRFPYVGRARVENSHRAIASGAARKGDTPVAPMGKADGNWGDRNVALPTCLTWVPQQLFHFRPVPAGVWTVCYHHNQWTPAQTSQFREDVEEYGANIESLETVLRTTAPRESRWSAWLCTHPRYSRLLIRTELKLWGWWSAAHRHRGGGGMDMSTVRATR